MAYIDAENRFFAEKTCATSMTSDVIDLGSAGGFLSPLYIDVKLTEKLTSGSMDSFKLQSASDDVFTTPVDEMEITVPAAAPQTTKPCTLAQFHAPIKPGNRYVRLLGSGTAPVGGKISASMQNGIAVNL